jgi:hypothetical protein
LAATHKSTSKSKRKITPVQSAVDLLCILGKVEFDRLMAPLKAWDSGQIKEERTPEDCSALTCDAWFVFVTLI